MKLVLWCRNLSGIAILIWFLISVIQCYIREQRIIINNCISLLLSTLKLLSLVCMLIDILYSFYLDPIRMCIVTIATIIVITAILKTDFGKKIISENK